MRLTYQRSQTRESGFDAYLTLIDRSDLLRGTAPCIAHCRHARCLEVEERAVIIWNGEFLARAFDFLSLSFSLLLFSPLVVFSSCRPVSRAWTGKVRHQVHHVESNREWPCPGFMMDQGADELCRTPAMIRMSVLLEMALPQPRAISPVGSPAAEAHRPRR